MANIPAFCDRCGNWYPGIQVDGTIKNGMFSNVTVGTCHCGGAVKVADGTYDVINGAINVVLSTTEDEASLKRLRAVLLDARDQVTTVDQLEQQLEEAATGAGALARLLPRTPEAAAAYLSALVLLLGVILNYVQSRTPSSLDPATINEIVEEVLLGLTDQQP